MPRELLLQMDTMSFSATSLVNLPLTENSMKGQTHFRDPRLRLREQAADMQVQASFLSNRKIFPECPSAWIGCRGLPDNLIVDYLPK